MAIAVEGDGKIVALNQTQTGYDIVRYNTDGALDSTFGVNGMVAATFGTGTTVVNLGILANGDIVVGGGHGAGGDSFVDVACFNKGGSFDSTFGTGGIAEVAYGGSADAASNIIAADMPSVSTLPFMSWN